MHFSAFMLFLNKNFPLLSNRFFLIFGERKLMKLTFIILLLVIITCTLIYRFFITKKKAPQAQALLLTFLGAPGSGKGTIAQQCVEKLGMQVLSTGNLCRQAIARGDELIKGLLKEGKLIPDEMISDMVKVWLKDNVGQGKTIVLDGYPRTARQAELLISLLTNNFPELKLHVISITISDDAIIQRISNRLMCETKTCQTVYSRTNLEDVTTCQKCGGTLIQREDDQEAIVRQRLEVYALNNQPLVDFYHNALMPFHNLNVENKSMNEVFENFKALYNNLK